MPTTVIVDSTVDAWVSTGVIVYPGDTLTATCSGVYDWDAGSVNGSGNGEHIPDLDWPVAPALCARFSLPLLLLPVGQVPDDTPAQGGTQYGANCFTFAYQAYPPTTVVSLTLTPQQIVAGTDSPGAWAVWTMVNDKFVGDNANTLALTLDLVPGEPPPTPLLVGAALWVEGEPVNRLTVTVATGEEA